MFSRQLFALRRYSVAKAAVRPVQPRGVYTGEIQTRDELMKVLEAEGRSKEELAQISKEFDEIDNRYQRLQKRLEFSLVDRANIQPEEAAEMGDMVHSIPHKEWAMPEGEVQFRLLYERRVSHMARGGRKSMMSALVIAGNGNGAAGYGIAKAPKNNEAQDKATNLAVRRLYPIDTKDGALHHSIVRKMQRTKVVMRAVPKGYGIRAHDMIRHVCEIAGVTDVGVDVIGSTNIPNLVRAAFACLYDQTPATSIATARGKASLEMLPGDAPLVLSRTPSPRAELEQHVPRSEALRDTEDWLLKFPPPITKERIRLARLLRDHYTRRQTMFGELEDTFTEEEFDELCEWLEQEPDHAVLSFSVLYPNEFAGPKSTLANNFSFK
eukprot:m.79928 g.79928  ORF g.79928 m.79928 type:complete len:381 (-) comp20888_c0_seq2:26-1168(-)